MPYRTQPQMTASAQSVHPLHRMRSENSLQPTERTVRRLRSLGQLSPPPQEPLPPLPTPPLPLRSPYRPVAQAIGFLHANPNRSYIEKHSPALSSDNISVSSSVYSQNNDAKNDVLPDGRSVPDGPTRDQHASSFIPSFTPPKPNRDDLKHILHLRGRLQAEGCTFDSDGEMQTYGHPASPNGMVQMIRLGALYDEKYALFFSRPLSRDEGTGLWRDICVLKRALENEGVYLNEAHKRLTFGDGDRKMKRLCEWFDMLREDWLVTTRENVHPALRGRQSFEMEDQTYEEDWATDGAGGDMQQDRYDGLLAPVMEEHADSFADQELMYADTTSSPPPHHIITTTEPSLSPNITPRTRPRPQGIIGPSSPSVFLGPGPLLNAGTSSTSRQDSKPSPSAPARGSQNMRRERTGILAALIKKEADEKRRLARKDGIRCKSWSGSSRSRSGSEDGKKKGVKKWLK